MLFDIRQVSVGETFPENMTLEAIQARAFDGVLISDFVSKEELINIKRSVANSDCDIHTIAPYGKIIGKKLNSDNGNFQELSLKEYLEYSNTYRNLMTADLGFDFEARIIDVGKKLGSQLKVPVVKEHSYIPAAVRCLFPGGGGIIPHVGNGFIEEMSEIVALKEIAISYNQLSYFLVVQLPEEGGELVLYDATFEEMKALDLSFQETTLQVQRREKQVITLREGDLIIFAGGEIWHEVTQIGGSTDRITIGGFMAPSIKKDKWYFWS